METKYLQELLELISAEASKGKTQLQELFEGLLTPSEFDQLVKRLQIVKQLKHGKTQREIADDLEVGIATVTRGSRELAKGRFTNV